MRFERGKGLKRSAGRFI